MGISSEQRDKYRRMLAWVVCAAMIAGVGWTGASCLRQTEDEPRAMTTAEAKRLSQVSANNAEAGTVAMSAQLPDSAGGGGLTGRVDWAQPLVQAEMTKNGTSKPHALVQAVPGLVAHRDGHARAASDAPEDGWSVRHTRRTEADASGNATTTIDIVLSAMLALRAKNPADPEILKAKGAWLRKAAIDGATVDVFRAPLLLDAPSKQAKKLPEAVFWVDADSRLRRVQFDPGTKDLATVDFLLSRKDVSKVEAIDLLGGAPIDPRQVSRDEADTLAQLRQRNSRGGATASIVVPVSDGKLIRAQGYVDWRRPMMYLAVDAPGKDNDGLLFVLPSGAATLTTQVDGKPPQQPQQHGWKAQDWSDRSKDGKASDLDTLLFKVLSMSNDQGNDADTVKDTAAWLRKDKLDDTATEVFEFPVSGDPETEKRGQAAFRYWVGAEDEALHRVEMRTKELGMARADLTPQTQPTSVMVPGPVLAGLS